MSAHVGGEEEQLQAVAHLIDAALQGLKEIGITEVSESKEVAYHVRTSLEWMAREAFRLGYRHAHRRSTQRPEDQARRLSSQATTKKLKK